jgi:uncharacterized protein
MAAIVGDTFHLRNPHGHLFNVDGEPHVLLSNGSRVYGLAEDAASSIERAVAARDGVALDRLLTRFGLDAPPYVDDEPPQAVPLRAVSLAVAQKCNLGCTYCYAEGGDFGGPAKNMALDVAYASIQRVIDQTPPGERANVAFLGGEPLSNRFVLYAATEFATERAAEKGVQLGFSITTNGTLITPEDGVFFERHGFSVTVSLDGVGAVHDAQRAFKGGRGSFDRIVERVTPLLAMQRRMQVSARVTVTPRNLRLRETLDGLIGLGFHSVGFSPMLSSPSGKDEMDAPELADMLEQMIACGRAFERRTIAGERYPFSNLATALHEIHKGTHRPYACGAGAGYMGVSADGGLFACHRFVDDDAGAMGDVTGGVDQDRQRDWLADRHVHFQEPCNTCWARYLCGGGCHHEVIHRGRPACDYIRGWLHYCLQAYVRVLERQPDFFGRSPA